MSILRQQFITPRKNTRPQLKLLSVKGIVMHYTATPKATAQNERDYFNNGAGGRSASAHIFVDKKEAIQIIPFSEVAYHANDHSCRVPQLKATASYYENGGANLTAIGVEMCIEKDGSLHPDTVARAVEVVAYLCKMYSLDETDIFRHYDVTGKNCPAMWVDNPSQFSAFKTSVKGKLSGTSKTPSSEAHVDAEVHIVSKGETLYSIAKLHGLSVDELKSLNGLKSNVITIGQKLIFKKEVQQVKYELPTGILKKGSRGSDVILLQKALVAVKFYPDKNATNKGVDGIFGNDTLDALTRFQKVYIANQVDGIYGQNVRAKLDQLLNK